jgi:hypothetical protein
MEVDAERRLTLEAGEHTLRVNAPDMVSRELRLDAKGGEEQTLRIELEPRHAVERKPGAIAVPQVEERDQRPALGVALTSAGGAAVLGGASLGIVALLTAKDADFQDGTDADRARRFALAADITLGVGIACAVTGVVLLLLRRKSEHARQRASFADVFPNPRMSF